MTHERRMEILKNSQVLKVQKDPKWSRDIEGAITNELLAIIQAWDKAAQTENIGPAEARIYFNAMMLDIYNNKIKEIEQVGEKTHNS